METYTLYIGANNNTGALELDRINRIMDANHQGYTLYTATGHWLGSEEPTAVVVVHDDAARIMATIGQLKSELQQDAIAYQKAPTMHFA